MQPSRHITSIPCCRRRVHRELLPALAAQLQRHLRQQGKPARAPAPQPDTAAAAAIERARAAQRRLPRSHLLAAPLAGACAAAAPNGGQPDALAVLDRITAMLPPPNQPLWPQVNNAVVPKHVTGRVYENAQEMSPYVGETALSAAFTGSPGSKCPAYASEALASGSTPSTWTALRIGLLGGTTHPLSRMCTLSIQHTTPCPHIAG